jgi:hypothetical protein
MQLIERRRKREDEIGSSQGILRVSAGHGVPGKSWGVTKIFQVALTVPAAPVGASKPRDTNARTERKAGGGTFRDFAHNLVTGDHLGQFWWQLAFHDVQVGAANPTGSHSQQDLAEFRLRVRDVGNLQGALRNTSRRVQDGSFHTFVADDGSG